MGKDDLEFTIDYVFEHYLDCDISDEQKEVVEKTHKEIYKMIENIEGIKDMISGMWDDENVCAGEIRDILK